MLSVFEKAVSLFGLKRRGKCHVEERLRIHRKSTIHHTRSFSLCCSPSRDWYNVTTASPHHLRRRPALTFTALYQSLTEILITCFHTIQISVPLSHIQNVRLSPKHLLLTYLLPSTVFPALKPSLTHQTSFPTGNSVISLFLFFPQRGPYPSPSPLGKGIALLLSRPVSMWMLWAAFRES